jgi:hypothetical protein
MKQSEMDDVLGIEKDYLGEDYRRIIIFVTLFYF